MRNVLHNTVTFRFKVEGSAVHGILDVTFLKDTLNCTLLFMEMRWGGREVLKLSFDVFVSNLGNYLSELKSLSGLSLRRNSIL